MALSREAKLNLVVAVIGALAAVWVVPEFRRFFHLKSEEPPAPSYSVINQVVAEPSAELRIMTADLHVSEHRDRVFWILPGAENWYYSFATVIQNNAAKEFKGCVLENGFTFANGANGGGATFVGTVQDFYDKGVNFGFSIPAGKTSTQQFFFKGKKEKPAWIRLRLRCGDTAANAQTSSATISPWYDVDLSHATGWFDSTD